MYVDASVDDPNRMDRPAGATNRPRVLLGSDGQRSTAPVRLGALHAAQPSTKGRHRAKYARLPWDKEIDVKQELCLPGCHKFNYVRVPPKLLRRAVVVDADTDVTHAVAAPRVSLTHVTPSHLLLAR